jgi:hypothetical protein
MEVTENGYESAFALYSIYNNVLELCGHLNQSWTGSRDFKLGQLNQIEKIGMLKLNNTISN